MDFTSVPKSTSPASYLSPKENLCRALLLVMADGPLFTLPFLATTSEGLRKPHSTTRNQKNQESSDSSHSWYEILPSIISRRAISSGSSFSKDSTKGLLPCLSCFDLLDTTLIRALGSVIMSWASLRYSSLTVMVLFMGNVKDHR